MDYYEGVSQGDYYLCDRCEITRLSYDEYSNNVRDIVSSDEKMRYCDECRNYMTLNYQFSGIRIQDGKLKFYNSIDHISLLNNIIEDFAVKRNCWK